MGKNTFYDAAAHDMTCARAGPEGLRCHCLQVAREVSTQRLLLVAGRRLTVAHEDSVPILYPLQGRFSGLVAVRSIAVCNRDGWIH